MGSGVIMKDVSELRLIEQLEHHEKAFEKRLMNGSVEMWLNSDNADYWGNTLPLMKLKRLFENYPRSTILTLGDGKGGKDGRFFQEFGHSGTVSDVATDVLAEAKNRGIIDNYLNINAESIELPNNSYDFCVCKEMLHHLPRPYLALYEMLRVAKKGVILIEPHNMNSNISRDRIAVADYEESGNYLYRFSVNELSMIARAYGIEAVGYNFGRVPEQKNAGEITGEELVAYKNAKLQIFKELDASKGNTYRSLLIFCLFKKLPESEVLNDLKFEGFITEMLNRVSI